LVAYLISTIEVRVSYFGPELAILSESVVIFLIIQVKTVVFLKIDHDLSLYILTSHPSI
jgi:hypothetical protein